MDCKYFPQAESIINGKLQKTNNRKKYTIINKYDNQAVTTINLKQVITTGSIIVYNTVITLLSIPFIVWANVWLNYRYERIVDTFKHPDALHPSQMINNIMFRHDTLGACVSCEAALVKQIPGENCVIFIQCPIAQTERSKYIKEIVKRINISQNKRKELIRNWKFKPKLCSIQW